MKYIAFVVFFCLSILFFNYRYLAPEAGISTRSPDYSTHIAIEQHLKNGLLFPELGKTEKGIHAVSKYLPVYHGLLGFHVSALLLEAIGIPLPGAYLFLMDLSLLICLLFFASVLRQEMKREKRWEHLVAVLTIATIFISNFTRAIDEAFFAQIMSYALLVLAWQMWGWQKRNWSIFFFLFAMGTYPDFLIWVLPVLIFNQRVRLHWAFRVGLGFIWAGLMYTLFTRRNLPGADAVSLYPLMFLPLILALFWKSLQQERRTFFLCLVSFNIVVIGFLVATQSNYTWGYYALKLTYPAVFFLVYAFATMPLLKSSRGRALLAVYVYFFWSSPENFWPLGTRYFERNEVMNNKFYSSVLKTKDTLANLDGKCSPTHTLVLPFHSDIPDGKKAMLGLWARNSMLLNSDISSGLFQDRSLRAIYGSFADFEKRFWISASAGNEHFFSTLKIMPPTKHDICIVSPASERSLFNDNPCFVILKEQGGQIYAQCKAQAEL
jgi:hypothetical protein